MTDRVLRRFGAGRALSLVLACLLLLTAALTGVGAAASSAWGITANLEVGGKIEYGGYDTNAFSVNGMEAYCGDPNSSTPAPGTYDMQPVANPILAACLWYGYGGPGFQPGHPWPTTSWNGAASADDYRVMTHLALAYLSSGSASFAYQTCDESFRTWCDQNLFNSGGPCDAISSAGFTLNGASDSRDTLPPGFAAYTMATGEDTQVMYAMSYRPMGSFSLKKSSSRPDISDGNSCYRLDGARFGIYSDASCANQVATMTTDAEGDARSEDLDAGTYYVKEIEAPAGFALDDTIYAVSLGAGDNGTLSIADEPQMNPLELVMRKMDAETGLAEPQGGATLADAEYEVRFYGSAWPDAQSAEESGEPLRTWKLRTNEAGELIAAEEAESSEQPDGNDELDEVLPSEENERPNEVQAPSEEEEEPADPWFHDSEGRIALPLGTVVIRETAAPAGYLLDDTAMVVPITGEGMSPSVSTFAAPAHAEQVIRGDLAFVKARETDQQRLANIPFRLTSLTTGESHVLVTDANGEAKTEAAWNPHDQRTNANDAAVSESDVVDETKLDPSAGIWFGACEADNALGALPFDTYSLEELPAEGNAGLQLISIPAITVTRNGYTIGYGTLDDQPRETPTTPFSAAGQPDPEPEPDEPSPLADEPEEVSEPLEESPRATESSPDQVELAATGSSPGGTSLSQTGDASSATLLALGAAALLATLAVALLLKARFRPPSKRKLYRDRLRRSSS